MNDRDKSRDQLLAELATLRGRVAELEAAEVEQKRVEERFRKSFDTESVAMAISRRRDGMYLEANPGFLKATGYAYDEIVGHTSQELDFLSPSQRRTLVVQLDEQGFLHNQELSFPTKDGTLRTILFFIVPIVVHDEDCFLATMVDITERKRAMEALQESEAKVRSIFRAAPTGIGLVSNRVLLDVNDRLCEITGYSNDELIGKNARILYPTDEAYETVGREKYRQIAEQGTGTVETCFQRKDGQIINVLLSSTPLDPADLSTGVTFTVLDITELKRTEEALRQTTERIQIQREIDAAILAAQSAEEIAHAALERLQDLIPCRRASIAEIDLARRRGRDLVFVVDGERIGGEQSWHPLSAVSQEAIEAIQRSQPYIVQDIAALETPSHVEQLMMDLGLRAYISVPLMVQHTLTGTLNMSSETPDFFTAGHVEILEEVAASLAIALQQARLLEQSQRDAETRALLLREVNHRVLNNLTMILSILKLEQRRPLDSKADFETALSDVASRIDGMSVIHRMLSDAEWTPLELAQVVTRVIHAGLSGSPIQREVEVMVDAPDRPLRVNSRQAIAVALIVNELTTNSVKYAFENRSQGRIDVQIAAQGDGDEDTRVQLTFRDDGPGMPEPVLAGKRQNVGLWLVETNATRALGGEMALRNDGGAVTSITFERAPLD